MQQITLHLYHCENCVAAFGAESHPDLNHSDVACPFCHSDAHITGVADDVPVQYEPKNEGD